MWLQSHPLCSAHDPAAGRCTDLGHVRYASQYCLHKGVLSVHGLLVPTLRRPCRAADLVTSLLRTVLINRSNWQRQGIVSCQAHSSMCLAADDTIITQS